ncbi:MAG: hypothetical protein AB7O56_05770 [Bauldia sp.]
MRRDRLLPIAIVIGMTLLLAACAAGPNPSVDIPSADGVLRGFWGGLWQGIISPVTFLISIFTDRVSVYEVHNTGGWYDFGFVLGAGILFGGGFLGIFRGMGRR